MIIQTGIGIIEILIRFYASGSVNTVATISRIIRRVGDTQVSGIGEAALILCQLILVMGGQVILFSQSVETVFVPYYYLCSSFNEQITAACCYSNNTVSGT